MTQTTSLVTAEKVTQLQKSARAVAALYRIADRKRAILYLAWSEKDLVEQYNKAAAGDGFETLRRALYFDLVRDAVAFTLDKGKKTASLHNVLKSLTDEDMRSDLRDQWGSGEVHDAIAESPRLASQARNRNRARQDEYYARLTAAEPSVLEGDLASRLKDARNQCIAHYELTEPGQEPDLIDPGQIGLKWGDIDEFFDQVEPLIRDAELVVSGVDNAFDNMRLTHAEIAERFWAVSKRPS